MKTKRQIAQKANKLHYIYPKLDKKQHVTPCYSYYADSYTLIHKNNKSFPDKIRMRFTYATFTQNKNRLPIYAHFYMLFRQINSLIIGLNRIYRGYSK